VFIGTCKLTFRLPGNDSLKGKRQVSRSLIMRLRNKFNVAVAEVDSVDRHQSLVIGVTCVSNDATYASELIDGVVRFVEQQQHLDAELIDAERDLLDGD
jgi:uncharacterized protein YlxP (DUF503 family)